MISLKIKKIFKKIFRIGALFVGSVRLPETHNFFRSALLIERMQGILDPTQQKAGIRSLIFRYSLLPSGGLKTSNSNSIAIVIDQTR